MRAYRAVWSTWTALTVCVGVALCAATSPVFVVVLLFATVGVCAGVISGNLHLLAEKPAPATRVLVTKVAKSAVCAGSAAVACYGFGPTMGAALVPLVVGVACTSPPFVGRVRRWADGESGPADNTLGAAAAEPRPTAYQELAYWSDAELYAVWCSSLASISRPSGSGQKVTVASAREYLLTEFERRHPEEVSAWLNSGAGLAGDPPRFLLDRDN
ncbi:hypothetical protein [Kribbella sp. CA-293567]|uniref:hypothetical protein n=1 Tax=Kribbella sp. CA-293567 TaxID=3002436 RepID=UPI0022DDF5E0|nr:hypothetical protein [Kribbella sp. CA-293567]WBQ03389.1 hypothetical protein OX958_25860 [Kribbella sp. CA-293567]